MSERQFSVMPVLGFVASGLSGAVLIAVSARSLSPVEFKGVGLVWTASTVFGVGFASPVEQFITRAVSAGAPRVLGPLRLLAGTALLAVLLSCAAAALSGGSDDNAAALLSWACSAAGWCLICPSRALAAGLGRFSLYAVGLFVEAGTRLIFILAGAVHGGSALLLGLGIGIPMLAAAGFLLVALRAAIPPLWGTRAGWLADLGAFLAVSVSFQICLSGPVFFVDWRSGGSDAEAVGQFVAANSYLRAPALLLGGMSVQGLARLSAAVSRRSQDQVAALDRALLGRGLLITVAGVSFAWLSVPVGLPYLYGAEVTVGPFILATLACSTALAMLGALCVQKLLAQGLTLRAGGAWFLAALITCLSGVSWVALGIGGESRGLGLVLLGGPLGAVVLTFFARVLPAPGCIDRPISRLRSR